AGDRRRLVRNFIGRDLNGKQKVHHKMLHGNERDAQRYLTAARREMDLGAFVEPAAISLSEYLKRWLRDAARPRVSARTADGYASLLERNISPRLGHMRLDKIQPLDIQGAYGEMLVDGLSARVVRHTHAALHNVVKLAVMWDVLARNPFDFVQLPKLHIKEQIV